MTIPTLALPACEADINQHVLDRFVALRLEIEDLVGRIDGANFNHYNLTPEQVNFGHVGSLRFTADKLQEIVDFLNI